MTSRGFSVGTERHDRATLFNISLIDYDFIQAIRSPKCSDGVHISYEAALMCLLLNVLVLLGT